MSKQVRRLFAGFAPKHYAIHLTPDRDKLTLTGDVIITGQKTGRPSQRLTFHQNGLTIAAAHIIKHDKKGDHEITVERINHHKGFNEVRLHSSQMLYPGNYTVRLHFSGVITKQMEGIYPCFFKQGDQEKKLIASQFESHHAREAFPCIDEPEAKATFDLTLTTPVGEQVIANTPIKDQKEADGQLVTTFETTPRMSTYLLAFVFGELKYLEAVTKHGVMVRTYATAEQAKNTQFALDVAVKTLEFYTDYFAIPYPLAKCDLVALPDFASGAMENWGCITFREQALLVDSANTSLPMKQYVANVVAHELAHQWFGNLVTMKWWNDLWLNEGFATWMAVFAVDKLFPHWQVWTQFITDDQHQGLKLDALENTHPIEVPIHHPDEIRTIFDAISYEKGASVIHMLAEYLGETSFRDGLRYYLQKHQYSNATTADLWSALAEISGKPVPSFMTAWIGQAGFPLVRALVGDSSLHLTQEPFLVNPISRKQLVSSKSQTLWPIALRSNHKVPELFDKEELKANYRHSDHPLVINGEHSGFYRVAYNASHLELLAEAVKRGDLSPLDRLGMLSDVFECAKAGYSGTAEALTFLEAYANEHDHAVWEVIVGNLGSIKTVMDDDQVREDMKPYIRRLAQHELSRLGWEPIDGEPHFDQLLRPTILGLAASADHPEVLAEINRRFAVMHSPEDIPPDIRGVILSTVARLGDAKVFEKLLAMHNASNSSEVRLTLTAALTNFKQPSLIKRALDISTTDNVRLQDVMYWVAYSFSNRHARMITWDWLVAHWDWLSEHLGGDLGFHRTPTYVARVMSDEKFLQTYQTFFDSVRVPVLERAIKQGVEMIQWQSAWRKRDLDLVRHYFAKNKKKNG